MKYLRNGSVALLLLFLPSLTFAAQQHKSVTIGDKAMVGTQQLNPGDYTLRWDDSQSTTNVVFQQNGKTVVTAPAQVVRASNPTSANYEVNNASGQPQLRRIYLAKEQLVFGDTTQASDNSPQANPPSQ